MKTRAASVDGHQAFSSERSEDAHSSRDPPGFLDSEQQDRDHSADGASDAQPRKSLDDSIDELNIQAATNLTEAGGRHAEVPMLQSTPRLPTNDVMSQCDLMRRSREHIRCPVQTNTIDAQTCSEILTAIRSPHKQWKALERFKSNLPNLASWNDIDQIIGSVETDVFRFRVLKTLESEYTTLCGLPQGDLVLRHFFSRSYFYSKASTVLDHWLRDNTISEDGVASDSAEAQTRLMV